jgi:hypothetical protein
VIPLVLALWLGADLGQLAGGVADSSGAALVDVALAAVHEDTGIRRTTRTDAAGRYLVAGLEPGLYKVTARKPGFQTLARLNVEVAAGSPVRLDFVMPVGSIREVLTVEDRPPEPHSADSPSGFRAGRRWIDALPLDGRGVLTLVELAPGVVATPASSGEAGQFSVNGQRPNKNSFTVDGVSVNSGVTGSAAPAQFSGGALPAMTAFGGLQNVAALDALHEARVEVSALAPEAGRMPGAQVRLSTRSGSNDWHGSVAYGFRHEKLAANDWFAASRGYARAPLRLKQWAAALGGPLRRDRTFFFAAWEGLRLRSPFAWRGATPSEESRQSAPHSLRAVLDAFPRPSGRNLGGGLAEYTARGSTPSRLDSGSLRIDHALTQRVALFGRFAQAPSTTRFGFQRAEEASFSSRSLTLGVNAALGGFTAESRLRVAGDSVAARWLGTDPGAFTVLSPSRPGAPPYAIYGLSIGGVGQLLSGATDGNRQGQTHLVGALGWTGAAHAWRAGVEYQRLTPARSQAATAIAGAWPDLATFLSGVAARTAVTQADQASSLIETLSSYVQDTWRPAPRLTMTYGIRWEITPAPSLRQTRIVSPALAANAAPSPPSTTPAATPAPLAPSGPLWPTRYGQIAPRIGAAYRVGERSVFRAGWGVFYDLGFSVATDPINGFPFNRWQFGDVGAVSLPAGPFSGPSFTADLRLPYTQQWDVSWERAIGASDTVAVSYVGSAGRQLLRREAGIQFDGAAGPGVATNHGRSDYHSLGVQYRRRLARSVEAVANYRWGHSIDNGSWDSAVAFVTPEYTADLDRGRSSFDVRHSFSAAVAYESRGGWWPRLTGGWKVQAILRGRSGFPIDVLEGENALGLGWDNYRRPDLVPGASVWLPGGRELNPAAFRAPSRMQGTLGRNAISGFGMFQADAALRRRFPLAESGSLEIGLACFNLANHPSMADPVRYRNNPFFGQSVSLLNLMLGNGSPRSGLTPAFQLGSPRSMEIVVKLRF